MNFQPSHLVTAASVLIGLGCLALGLDSQSGFKWFLTLALLLPGLVIAGISLMFLQQNQGRRMLVVTCYVVIAVICLGISFSSSPDKQESSDQDNTPKETGPIYSSDDVRAVFEEAGLRLTTSSAYILNKREGGWQEQYEAVSLNTDGNVSVFIASTAAHAKRNIKKAIPIAGCKGKAQRIRRENVVAVITPSSCDKTAPDTEKRAKIALATL